MKLAKVHSRCECEAGLYAEVDDSRRAVRGWARDRRGRELLAPANSMNAGNGRFDVGWMCPFCTRNTLRSFDAGALAYRSP